MARPIAMPPYCNLPVSIVAGDFLPRVTAQLFSVELRAGLQLDRRVYTLAVFVVGHAEELALEPQVGARDHAPDDVALAERASCT